MTAEKAAQPKRTMPEDRERLVAPEQVLSPETAHMSLEMAHEAASGKRPTPKQVASFVERVAKDMGDSGPKIDSAAVQKTSEQLVSAPKDTGGEVVQLPSLGEIRKTLEYVEKLYATPQVRKKIKAASASMIGLELVMGAGQYAWQEFFDKVIGNKDELTIYSGLLHEWMQGKNKKDFQKLPFLGKVLGKTAGLWAPTVVNLVADQAILRANKALNGALEEVGNRINQRTTESLLLQNYAFIQDIPPSEVLAIIERGKFATIDLIAALRADAYPGMARIVSNLIPAWQINPLASVLGLARLWPLYKSAEKNVKSLIFSRGKMYSEVDLIDARIASLLSNLEIAQASGKSDEVARELQQMMRMREELYGKQRQKNTEREGSERLWHYVFNKIAPWVVTGTEYLQAYKKNILPLINEKQNKEEQSWIRAMEAQSAGGDDVNDPPFYGAPKEDVEGEKWRQSMTAQAEGYLGLNYPAQSVQSGIKGDDFSRRLAEAHIRTAFLAGVKANQFSGIQASTAGETSRLASIYANNLIPDLQDIAEMEKLLGPWDALDRPDGPLEQRRIPASALNNLDISVNHLSVMGILHDVSFDIKQGEFVSIRAQKGEGKTTLLRAMLGLNLPHQGSVSYGGVEIDGIKKFGPEALHAKFGYSPQSAGLIDTMTLKENLLLWNKDIPDEKLISTMKDLGLEKLIPRLEETGNHFSGGEKRLLSIVRALLTNPKILFLDEPTANLDPASIDRLVATLQAIRKNHPETTIIAVTHDDDFAKHTDRVINLAELNKKPAELKDNQVLEARANALPK